MDGIHDIGGMHGFGAVDVADADAFHAGWEKRVMGVRMAMNLAGHGQGSLRPRIEALPADVYLTATYYEKWALAMAVSLVRAGLLSEADIAARVDAIVTGKIEPPATRQPSSDLRGRLAGMIAGVTNHGHEVPARFSEGDRVRVKRMAPSGHTRCPRYARGVEGTVERATAGFARPDPGQHPVEPIYTVRFDLHDLWGDDAEDGVLYLDLWEGYLE